MVPTGTLSTAEGILRNPDAVSVPALELYRLLQRLSQRTGTACVRLLATLARMHGRCERATRYALAELVKAGWLERTHTRSGGKSLLFLRPLVRVAARGRGRFGRIAAAAPAPSSARPVAGRIAGCPASRLQDAPSSPYEETPAGKGDDKSATSQAKPSPVTDAGVVVPPSLEPDPSVRRRAEAAARAYAEKHPVRSWPALLRVAIRDRWEPPAAVATEARVGPHRLVTAPPDYALRSKEARQAVSAPQPGAEGAGSGQEALRAALSALRGRA